MYRSYSNKGEGEKLIALFFCTAFVELTSVNSLSSYLYRKAFEKMNMQGTAGKTEMALLFFVHVTLNRVVAKIPSVLSMITIYVGNLSPPFLSPLQSFLWHHVL